MNCQGGREEVKPKKSLKENIVFKHYDKEKLKCREDEALHICSLASTTSSSKSKHNTIGSYGNSLLISGHNYLIHY